MNKLLPVLLVILGIGGGAGAGIFLRPAHDEAGAAAHPADDSHTPAADTHAASDAGEGHSHEYVKMNNQFIIPVVKDGRVESLVVMSLSLEVQAGQTEFVFSREPKLRDSFLQVLFDHANMGGFDGAFTNSNTLATLRSALFKVAADTLGNVVSDVLIVDIARQDT